MEHRSGYVYFLATEDWRFVKIGRSIDLDKRVQNLKIQLPFRVHFIHAIRSDDAIWLESFLHKAYETFRRNGEWFEFRNLFTVKQYLGAWLKRSYWDLELQQGFANFVDSREVDEVPSEEVIFTADMRHGAVV